MRRLHTKPSPSLSEKFMDCNSLCAAAKLQILLEKVIQGSETAAGTPLGWQWGGIIWQSSPKQCDLASALWGGGWKSTSCHSQRGTHQPTHTASPWSLQLQHQHRETSPGQLKPW